MMLPLFCRYICRSAARVVRNAPSKWIASIFFHFGKLEFDERSDDLDAGIADQDVESAERLDDLCHADIDLLFVRDVHRDPEGSLAIAVELTGGRVGGFQIQIGNGHLGAFAHEHGRDLFADAAARTGDHRRLV
jgi:hypothetical protein